MSSFVQTSKNHVSSCTACACSVSYNVLSMPLDDSESDCVMLNRLDRESCLTKKDAVHRNSPNLCVIGKQTLRSYAWPLLLIAQPWLGFRLFSAEKRLA